jgi:hypothetical protein
VSQQALIALTRGEPAVRADQRALSLLTLPQLTDLASRARPEAVARYAGPVAVEIDDGRSSTPRVREHHSRYPEMEVHPCRASTQSYGRAGARRGATVLVSERS